MSQPVYLDYNSTTPVDPEVFEAMEPYFLEKFGNASTKSHAYGWEAEEAVDQARETIAQAIGAKDPRSILFTSGATESSNLALLGLARGLGKKSHFITQKTEHKCVLDCLTQLEKEGHQVTVLGVDSNGLVDPEEVYKSVKANTVLCSVMMANNEIGTLQPVSAIGNICREKGILFHTDAVQALGKIPIDVERMGIDLMSLSAHKLYGPKGIGALYVARKNSPISLEPLLFGGGHERGKRSGTLNVPGIVGLAKAVSLCLEEMAEESERLCQLRDGLIQRVLEEIPDTLLNGHPTLRLPNNVNLSFEGVKADELILTMPEIAVSTGSACASGSPEPSYVIQAIADAERASSAIRLGLGRWTTQEDVDLAVKTLLRAVPKLRSKSLEYEMKKGTHGSAHPK